jgi:flagellar biosynthesis/type III secretory pathway protein FliH
MTGPEMLLHLMRSLQPKAEAYRDVFPMGSPIDPQSPAYVDMLQSLQAAQASVKQLQREQLAKAKELLGTFTKLQQQAKEQGVKLAAQEAAQEKEMAARVKAALDKVGPPGLATLPFEKAYSPKLDRLQQIISRFSSIGHTTKEPQQ